MHLFSPEHMTKITWVIKLSYSQHPNIFQQSLIVSFLSVHVTLTSEVAELIFEVTFENES